VTGSITEMIVSKLHRQSTDGLECCRESYGCQLSLISNGQATKIHHLKFSLNFSSSKSFETTEYLLGMFSCNSYLTDVRALIWFCGLRSFRLSFAGAHVHDLNLFIGWFWIYHGAATVNLLHVRRLEFSLIGLTPLGISNEANRTPI